MSCLWALDPIVGEDSSDDDEDEVIAAIVLKRRRERRARAAAACAKRQKSGPQSLACRVNRHRPLFSFLSMGFQESRPKVKTVFWTISGPEHPRLR